MSQQGMETKNDKGIKNYKLELMPWLLEALQSYCRLLEYLVNSSLLLIVPFALQLVQPFFGDSVTIPRDPKGFVHTLQSQVLNVFLLIWSNPMFCFFSPPLINFGFCIISHVYTTIGDVKESINGIPGSTNQ